VRRTCSPRRALPPRAHCSPSATTPGADHLGTDSPHPRAPTTWAPTTWAPTTWAPTTWAPTARPVRRRSHLRDQANTLDPRCVAVAEVPSLLRLAFRHPLGTDLPWSGCDSTRYQSQPQQNPTCNPPPPIHTTGRAHRPPPSIPSGKWHRCSHWPFVFMTI